MLSIVNIATIRVLALSSEEVELEILTSEVKGPDYLGEIERQTVTLKIMETHKII